MRFFDSLDDLPADFGPCAVILGKFDGVHLGHRAVIRALTDAAAARSLTSVAITFDRNPLTVLDPAKRPADLVSAEQKRDLLAETGLDVTLELKFSHEFSAQTPEEFIERVLVEALHTRLVLVGPDARFGVGGSGTVDTLVAHGRTHGFDVQRLEPELAAHDLPASSTLIRRMLGDGDVRGAAAVLGRHPLVRSMVVHGQKRGRALGYPTANLDPSLDGFVPADGVYAGYLTVVTDGVRDERMPAAISVGNNPTFDGVPEKQVEAFVLDRTIDLYDRVVEVEFVERVRGMTKFDSLNDLIDQMADDTMKVRGLLGV